MKSHARTLIRLLRELKRPVLQGVEIGVWKGELSAELLRAFPELTLFMVDPWSEQYNATMAKGIEEIQAAEKEARERTDFAIARREIIKDCSISAITEFMSGGSLDFGFVDACHLYPSVRDDMAWYQKVRPGGLFAGHDYNGLMDRRGKWGVKRAVDSFAADLGYKVQSSGLVWWFYK